LTGIIAGLTAQGLNTFNAGLVGAYIHGRAGDIAKKEKGEMGLIASDVLESIPYAIESIKTSKKLNIENRKISISE
jgi:NAD(P)H-hydrate epimerase